MYPMVKIPSSFLLYVCQTIQSSIVPCPIPWPGGCNDRVVMTMVEGDTRVTVRHDIRMVTQCAVAVPPSWADQSVPPGVAPVTSVTTAHWGAHNRITLHNTDQHTIYCNMPLNATAWKTKSKSLLLISPVGEDMWHDGRSPQLSFSCVHHFNFFQFLNLSEIIVWLLQQAAVPSPSVVLTLQWQHSRLGHNCRRCAALLWWLHVQGGSANMWQCGAGQCRKWFIAGGLRLG